MNISNLPYYLEDLTRLEELELSAINALIDQYPYMQQLRFLAAKKAHLIKDETLSKTSELAAMYTSYPEDLYNKLVFEEIRIIKNVGSEADVFVDEESTEDARKGENLVGIAAAGMALSSVDVDAPKIEENEDGLVVETKVGSAAPNETEAVEPLDNELISEVEVEEELAFEENEESELDTQNVGEDEVLQQSLESAELSEFSKWLLDKRHLLFEDEPLHKPKIQQIKKHKTVFVQKEEVTEIKNIEKVKKADKTPKIKDKSDQINEQIASESLAELYVEQGYKKRAISMYEKLRLIFPEKSAYFAAQIQKIKEN